ncbi:type VI secretion system protein ImpL [Enterobacter asburiae]|uniref:Type VI secretion system protein ImpL n=1 Tax=Enterobacter asburiae TaxID=61645 RepID=A0A376FA90_ENTAS|nr:type VI secretion system protein ImpL [Enterobacter asburiae]
MTNRILWSFLGVTALAAVIWMIGPLLSIVDTRPLESEQNRIISIAVVYLLLGARATFCRACTMPG